MMKSKIQQLKIAKLAENVRDLKKQISAKDERVSDLEEQNRILSKQLLERDERIAELEQKLRETTRTPPNFAIQGQAAVLAEEWGKRNSGSSQTTAPAAVITSQQH